MTQSTIRLPIEQRILLLRGQKVLLDAHLAHLYGVRTKELNKAVSRNLDRFPDDFMFQLTTEETRILRFQSGTLRWGEHSKYLPRVFTEQGVAMLSSVLRSQRAVQANIAIMRAFVRLRETLAMHAQLARKLNELEARVSSHDEHIQSIFLAIKELMDGAEPKNQIGFKAEEEGQ